MNATQHDNDTFVDDLGRYDEQAAAAPHHRQSVQEVLSIFDPHHALSSLRPEDALRTPSTAVSSAERSNVFTEHNQSSDTLPTSVETAEEQKDTVIDTVSLNATQGSSSDSDDQKVQYMWALGDRSGQFGNAPIDLGSRRRRLKRKENIIMRDTDGKPLKL